MSDDLFRPPLHVGIFVGYPGSGGNRSGMSFPDLQIPVPARVRRAPSVENLGNLFLSEPDLYLGSLGIQNIDAEVAAALKEAVTCFRHELFTAAVAMLGKASEGAWIGLGASLLASVPPPQSTSVKKQRDALEDPMMGTMKKIQAVIQLYERHDLFSVVYSVSDIKPPELRGVQVWSDQVRDSRNTIHFGVAPATPNTYEKVAALLLGVALNLKVSYLVKAAADAHPVLRVRSLIRVDA